jgi:hypothetical protein
MRLYSDSARRDLEVELREDQVLPWRRSFLGYALRRAFAAPAFARICARVDDRAAAIAKLDTLLAMPSPVSCPAAPGGADLGPPLWRARVPASARPIRLGGDRHGRAARSYFDAWTFSPIFLA